MPYCDQNLVLGTLLLPDLTSSVKSGQDRHWIISPKRSGLNGGRQNRQGPKTGESARFRAKFEMGLDFDLYEIH
jgi:hypothetical protein